MNDVEGSQAGESEQPDDFEEETKLFLVSRHWCIVHVHEEPYNVRLTDTQYFQLPGSTPTAASFEFRDESHTLGNALRYIIMKK